MQPLLERYGMTEIGMALSNPYDGHRVAGTVGQPLPGVQVRISPLKASTADPSADGYHGMDRTLALDAQEASEVSEDDSGEIRVKGPCLFKEYWQSPGATADAFDEDGYFRTGAEDPLACLCVALFLSSGPVGTVRRGQGPAAGVSCC